MTRPDVAAVFPAMHRRGGVERMCWDFLAYLAPRRDAAFVGREAPEGLPDGVRFLPVPPSRVPGPLQPLWFRRSAAQTLRSARPGTTVTFGAEAPPGDVLWVGSVLRAWLRVARSVPVGPVTVPAAVRFLMPHHRVMLALESAYFRRSHPRRILCTSEREVADLAHLYDVDPRLCTVVPNPFDPDVFNRDRRESDRAGLRAAMGVQEGEIALLLVANELHRKGFAQAVEALARASDERMSLHLVGRAAPTPYAPLIERLGLTERVRYHGPTDDVARYFAAADLLVLPTQYEPFGLVIIEALASGLPVVTTRLAGAAPAIAPGRTGLLQDDPYDVDELADLLRQAVAADLERWSEAAAASVDEYRRDRVMGRVEELVLG